ncbi:50S ribosomal protein L22 [Malacoplasma penetrans]|nr:50S ribosomal protein L22 [Malacoplasma penetrans]RXY96851.1 50S ribosomal protein L22 [Malacoplasma penetrans]
MQARAIQKNIHVSPRKAKLVCDLIRNKPVTNALSILENTNKKTAVFLKKLLHQAIANATNNHAMQADKLYVYHVVANQGSTLKRTSPRAKGSADLIRKRHTHLEIVLSDDVNERNKEIQAIKDRIKKRAANNKGYSAKQRAANEAGLKVVEKPKKAKPAQPKKPVEKKPQPKPEPKVVKEEPVTPVKAESLKREQEVLKVVETKPVEGAKKAKVEETAIIMISTKKEYADNLLNEELNKNVFFYKVTPVNPIKRVLIYTTTGKKGVVGEFDLDKIEILALSTAWKKYGQQSCMSKKDFDEYYKDSEKAHILISKEAFRYSRPKTLESYNMKKGPSGFQYLK